MNIDENDKFGKVDLAFEELMGSIDQDILLEDSNVLHRAGAALWQKTKQKVGGVMKASWAKAFKEEFVKCMEEGGWAKFNKDPSKSSAEETTSIYTWINPAVKGPAGTKASVKINLTPVDDKSKEVVATLTVKEGGDKPDQKTLRFPTTANAFTIKRMISNELTMSEDSLFPGKGNIVIGQDEDGKPKKLGDVWPEPGSVLPEPSTPAAPAPAPESSPAPAEAPQPAAQDTKEIIKDAFIKLKGKNTWKHPTSKKIEDIVPNDVITKSGRIFVTTNSNGNKVKYVVLSVANVRR